MNKKITVSYKNIQSCYFQLRYECPLSRNENTEFSDFSFKPKIDICKTP